MSPSRSIVPGSGRKARKERLVADQVGDPPAHLAGKPLDVRRQGVGRRDQALGHQARQIKAAHDRQYPEARVHPAAHTENAGAGRLATGESMHDSTRAKATGIKIALSR